jgi:hypothetical protein
MSTSIGRNSEVFQPTNCVVTWDAVDGFEQRGNPVFWPIWDS